MYRSLDQESQAETIRIRVASAEDIPNIAATFLESAQYHAHLDPERYSVPELETISARYQEARQHPADVEEKSIDRKSTRLNSSHVEISYAVFCLKKKIAPLDEELRPERHILEARALARGAMLLRPVREPVLPPERPPLAHRLPAVRRVTVGPLPA